MKKKILFFTLLALTMICSTAFATIGVKLNDTYIDFTDENGLVVNPTIINDRTMVPMRKIFETFNAEIEWNNEERKVTAVTDEKTIVLKIDSEEATVKAKDSDEVETIILDAAPVILDGRTMVPVRFIAESLEKQVGWDNENRCVIIMDYSFLKDDIKANAPALVDLIENQTQEIESYKINCNINGTLNYKDKEDKSNNENLKIKGDMLVEKNKENNYSIEVNLKATGEGEIAESLKEAGYDNIKYLEVGNEEKVYAKSNLIPNSEGKKWIEADDSAIATLLNLTENETITIDSLVDTLKIEDSELNIYSYEMLTSYLSDLYKIIGEDNFKVSGSSNRRYELNLDLAEIYRDVAGIELLDLLSDGSMNLNIVLTCKSGVAQKFTMKFKTYLEDPETRESIQIELEIDGTYSNINKDVKISMPKASEIA